MTMQRGEDPEKLPLVAFGGAGGLAAAALADSLHMTGALVPARPGVLSAWGMATADGIRDHVKAVLEPVAGWNAKDRERVLGELAQRGREELEANGHAPGSIEFELALDLRYRGQSFEISIPEPNLKNGAEHGVADAFHARHAELYGYRLDDRVVELVSLRARTVARHPRAIDDQGPAQPPDRTAPASAVIGKRRAWFEQAENATILDRSALAPGHVVQGPALIEEFSGTTIVPPVWTARVTRGAHLWLAR
jgi:N-methylhydantoinase A